MRNYVDLKFLRIFGAPVRIHWAALVVVAGIFVLSLRTPILALIGICSYLAVILLHEAGHAFFARRLGYEVDEIRLGFFHGLCVHETSDSAVDEALIAWGGVVAQLAVAIPLIVLAQLGVFSHVPGSGPIVAFLGYISALVALLNLAPSPGLDGSKAWKLIPIMWRARRAKRATPQKRGVVKGPWDSGER